MRSIDPDPSDLAISSVTLYHRPLYCSTNASAKVCTSVSPGSRFPDRLWAPLRGRGWGRGRSRPSHLFQNVAESLQLVQNFGEPLRVLQHAGERLLVFGGRTRGLLSDVARDDPRPPHAAASAVLEALRVSWICPTNRRTPRCPTRSRWGSSLFWSWGRWPAARLGASSRRRRFPWSWRSARSLSRPHETSIVVEDAQLVKPAS